MPGVGPPSFVGFADMDKSLIQTAPYFFRDDRNPAYLANMFAGQSIFLLCGGPSLASTDWARLRDAQVMSCAVNNAAVLYRPDIWVSVDSAGTPRPATSFRRT